MTQAERDVIEAACAAVNVRTTARIVAAEIVTDTEKLNALVRAVARLKLERAGGYWRET